MVASRDASLAIISRHVKVDATTNKELPFLSAPGVSRGAMLNPRLLHGSDEIPQIDSSRAVQHIWISKPNIASLLFVITESSMT